MHQQTKLLTQIIEIANKAGSIIMDFYSNANFTVTKKEDGSPVTDADLQANDLIVRELKKISTHPIITEESLDNPKMTFNDTFWLIDPLDGTKEFISRTGEFTVNIALIEKSAPVLGVIFAPFFGHMFFAQKGYGAGQQQEGNPSTILQTKKMHPESFTYLMSRKYNVNNLKNFKTRFPHASVIHCGSSLKFCRIAEGQGDVYIRRGGIYEWDTAAGHCILEEAGGKITSLEGEALRYGHADLQNKNLIACGDKKAPLETLFNPSSMPPMTRQTHP